MNIADTLSGALPTELRRISRALGELAAPQTLYIVGGAVRDILLDRPLREIDFVLDGDAMAFADRAESAGLGRKKAASQFMTVKLSIGEHEIDLVSARRETYASPGALPSVAAGDIAADLARRDFAANAIAVSVSPDSYGNVTDLHGGLADVEARTLRALHKASFQDDATRIIRAARYAARLGFILHPETEAWIRRDAAYIETIGPDRLRNEFERMWSEPAPEMAMNLLSAWGVADNIPTGSHWGGVHQRKPNSLTVTAATPADILIADVYWALLAAAATTESAALIEAFNLTGRSREAVQDIARWMTMDGGALRRDSTAGPRSRTADILAGFSGCCPRRAQAHGDARDRTDHRRLPGRVATRTARVKWE